MPFDVTRAFDEATQYPTRASGPPSATSRCGPVAAGQAHRTDQADCAIGEADRRVYSPGEANSVVIVEALKKAVQGTGLTVVDAAAPRTVDVAGAAQSLVGKADVFYAPTDNNVASAFGGLAKVADQAKMPLIAADTDVVNRGAVAALGLNYYDLGRQTGKQVVRILKGESPGKIAPEISTTFELNVSRGAAPTSRRRAVG
jgi:ABC-type uncharacterized transport system substrate-binding protein